jgi:hypothetical protein
MPVAIEMNFKGATLDQYDQILAKMGLKLGGPMPDGGMCHWAATGDGGLRIVDLWETREQFDRFAQEQIGPYSREVGITEEPEFRYYEVHNYLIRS